MTRSWGIYAAGLTIALMTSTTGFAQDLSFFPNLSIPEQTDFTVELTIDALSVEVTGVHVNVSFNPAVVQLESIEPGTWLEAAGAAGSGYFFHDFTPTVEPGVLKFDAAVLAAVGLGAGQLVVCHFTALGPGESPLTFVEVDVRGPQNEVLGFGHSAGDLIRIEPGRVHFDPSTNNPTTIDFTVDIAIGAAGIAVKGAEVEVLFDPALVELTNVTAGDWITDQGLFYYFYDHTEPGSESIHLTMSFLDGSGTGSGVLAVCHFSALAVGETPLTFVNVDVRGPDNQNLDFGFSEGDRIIVDQAIHAETATLGSVKSMFY